MKENQQQEISAEMFAKINHMNLVDSAHDLVEYLNGLDLLKYGESKDQSKICHLFQIAVNLLGTFTVNDFLMVYRHYNKNDDVVAAETALIEKYGSDTYLSEKTLEIIYDYLSNESWARFLLGLLFVFEYIAKSSGETNPYNDFRISKSIADGWELKTLKVWEEDENGNFQLIKEYTEHVN